MSGSWLPSVGWVEVGAAPRVSLTLCHGFDYPEKIEVFRLRNLPPRRTVLTLAPEEISRFLVRTRRDRDFERIEVRLDEHLREVLERADDFVPSQAGAILLDDPRVILAAPQP